MSEKQLTPIQEALQNLDVIIRQRAGYKTGEEALIAFKSLELVAAKCLEEQPEPKLLKKLKK